jgi:hypothetical protein
MEVLAGVAGGVGWKSLSLFNKVCGSDSISNSAQHQEKPKYPGWVLGGTWDFRKNTGCHGCGMPFPKLHSAIQHNPSFQQI